MGHIHIHFKVLPLTIMETEKSLNLPSTSWRLRRASDVVQRPENQRVDRVDSSLGLKA